MLILFQFYINIINNTINVNNITLTKYKKLNIKTKTIVKSRF